MGSGGGDVQDIEKQTPGQLKPWQQTEFNLLQKQRRQDPFLSAAGPASLDYFNNTLPGAMAKYPGYEQELQGAQGKLGNIYGGLGNLLPQLSGYQQQGQGLFNQLGGLSSQIGGYLGGPGGINATIASHGALSQADKNRANQEALLAQEQGGTAHTNAAFGSQLLNQEQYQRQRFNEAYQQGLQGTGLRANISGQQGGILGLLGQLTSAKGDIYGKQQGNVLAGAGLTKDKASLQGQQQNLLSGGLQQLLGVGQTGVNQLMQLLSPAFGAIAGNQQASAQQAQLQAQSSAASGQGIGDLIGSIASIVGPILGAVAMSDKRLKTKIKDTGMRTEDDIPIKTFQYKTRPGISLLGVIAQDVQKKRPDVVYTDPLSGVKSVNLWKLKVPMMELKEA